MTLAVTVGLLVFAGCASAQEFPEGSATDLNWPQVKQVVATKVNEGIWRFDVTVEHNDEGWDHYADAWQIVHAETDRLIGERVLFHPHDDEQPFTRSISRVEIPAGITAVVVRARCTVHGFGPVAVQVDLGAGSGEHSAITSPDSEI